MTSLSGRALRAGAWGVLTVFAVLVLVQPLSPAVGRPLAYLVQVVTAGLAVAALLRGAAAAADGRLRRARLLLAGALGCGAAAGLLATGQHLATGRPPAVASFVDVVHLAWIPLVVAALLSSPVVESRPGSRSRCLVDGLVAATALWFVAHTLLLGPAQVGEGADLLSRLTVLAYPVGDVFVLGIVASLLARTPASARHELVLTGGGLAVYAVSDLAYSALQARGTYRADSWVSLVAEAGLLLVLAGAVRGARGRTTPVPSERVLALLPQVPVALAVGVAAVLVARGGGLDAEQLVAACAFVLSLLLRHVVTGRDRDALTVRIQAREELWRALVTGSSDLVTLHDPDATVRYASPAVGRALGVAVEDVVGGSMLPWIHRDDMPALEEAWRAALAQEGGSAETLCRVHGAAGDRWMQTQVQNRLHERGVRGVVVNSRDVHERHLLERELSRAAHSDPLTGLGNRSRALQLLGACYAATPPRPATVLLVDLDGFKAVNDTFGHGYGDRLLAVVADRLRACVRAGDEVTRIGGDEFVLVLDGDDDAAAARVVAAVAEPVEVAGTLLTVGASVGIAHTADASSPDDLLRNADLAMYASKDAGRNRSTAYAAHMHEAAARRMLLDRGLRGALDEDRLELHYQPIVSLPDGAVVGAEALLRWDDPVQGPVLPEEFIPVAEESGLIAELDLWVLERACRDLAGWRAAGLTTPRVSINISRRQLTAELPAVVGTALARHGLTGSDLCLEVTESAVVLDADVASAALAQVRATGVQVALDDFGTGQSSLSQLARLPVDTVKIDRSFTTAAVSDEDARRLLMSIVHVCQVLSLPVVAEGIEHVEVAELLALVGCGRGQGWHFGWPEPEQHFRSRLAAPVVRERRRAGRRGAVVVPG